MLIVKEIIDLLKNGEWLSYDDITHNCVYPRDSIDKVLNFLEEFNFAERENDQKFRLTSAFLRLNNV